MFDIGFSEVLLLLILGLIVLGPKRLPLAIRTVMGWVNTLRKMATNVQNELAQELKLQELQATIKKAEQLNMAQLSPELAQTVESLRESALQIQSEWQKNGEKENNEKQTSASLDEIDSQETPALSRQWKVEPFNPSPIAPTLTQPNEPIEINTEGENKEKNETATPNVIIEQADYFTNDELANESSHSSHLAENNDDKP